ncbi:hypothetical protein TCAL_01455 [Tigriopus californicus]|uniref:Elongation of very long chain fatty acids protein n=1 Tax=Tigriopus californicus TaxID=6832 RepID=A0A553N9T4_TIGCA|nr:elongation of very long chain fatty acids protein AAEL008004-like [Tigriopus californicus]TRY62206.1 hypothetical protein TCAL_01455 [Tigriopus californicus]|eukprot:TCALIF_01455-PA protein Name:"Similar to AAEL008004 Elongation of very long chain fatty acids protein AAEL008004 (Aedes aegypti)" AED:0.11 eAED:0.11 QI:313/1/1/1/1/1/2/82/267
MGSLIQSYHELWEIRDLRVEGWPMMSTPWPTVALSAAYVYLVTIWGPRFMKDRKPYELKMPIQIYNIIQVVLSAYIVYEACVSGWTNHYSWVCQPVETSSDPDSNAMRMARIVWIYYLSKFVEFLDTFFFIARKKFSHVSVLQVVHHSIMPIFAYCLCRWLPGGHESFGGMLNSVVHFIMYGYYFMAALGPQFQKYLWWKKYLTTFQMIQFLAVFTKSMILILGLAECGYPWQFSAVTASIMVVFFILFANFFIQNYLNKPKSRKSA